MKKNNELNFLVSMFGTWRSIPTAEKKLLSTLVVTSLLSLGLNQYSKKWNFGWVAFSLTLPFMKYFISDKPHQDKTINEYQKATQQFEDHVKQFPLDWNVNNKNHTTMKKLLDSIGGELAYDNACYLKLNH